ncbi:Zinc finger A20 and AN1 domain-containing stress-associated protein 1 [Apostasia shenzhenica]|uniref:Zinc finger A20 and AN1 domain-containing stress-associated protein 1 n=1 Tax=Apostasia shenzhenica TaxID=1088818 RepID=A0A2I0BG93_9ASPA|nr:Zinc finger A20 and AN1 domain-containing stress-associated protein 1 [Apostasia shenzhenica]
MDLCSKCYRDLRLKEEQASSAKIAVEKSLSSPSHPAVAPGRCTQCRKKVGLTGFRCRCGLTFCGTHRYPEQHGCSFDFKTAGREAIARANPVVKAAKLGKI